MKNVEIPSKLLIIESSDYSDVPYVVILVNVNALKTAGVKSQFETQSKILRLLSFSCLAFLLHRSESDSDE